MDRLPIGKRPVAASPTHGIMGRLLIMIRALVGMTFALALSLSATQAQVTVVVSADKPADVGLPFRITVDYHNYGTAADNSQSVDVTLPPSFTLKSAPDFCYTTG